VDAGHFAREEVVPILYLLKATNDHLLQCNLATVGVEPHDTFPLLRAQLDHVVVARHDGLLAPLRVRQDVLIAGLLRRLTRGADMLNRMTEFAKSPRCPGGHHLVEEKASL
jgi:hypothetical protein